MILLENGQERELTAPGDVDLTPTDWSRDGQWLLGACQLSSPRRVGSCVMPVGGAQARPADVRVIAADPAKNYFESRFSPNQRWVSFVSVDRADARVSRIMIVPAEGGEPRPITDGEAYDDKPHWARDGRTLYFLSDRQGFFNVWGRHIDPETGSPERSALPGDLDRQRPPQRVIGPAAGADRRHRVRAVPPDHRDDR